MRIGNSLLILFVLHSVTSSVVDAQDRNLGFRFNLMISAAVALVGNSVGSVVVAALFSGLLFARTALAPVKGIGDSISSVTASGTNTPFTHSKVGAVRGDSFRKPEVHTNNNGLYLIIRELISIKTKRNDEVINIHPKAGDVVSYARRKLLPEIVNRTEV